MYHSEKVRIVHNHFNEDRGEDLFIRAKRDSTFQKIKSAMRRRDGDSYPHLTPLQKASLVAGVTATPFGLAATLTAIESSPNFQWTGQTISSLLSGPNGLLLSASLVTSGLLASSFTYGFRESLPPSKIYNAGAVLFAASSTALSVAGVVHPPSSGHFIAAATYFLVAPVTMGMIGVGMIVKGAKIVGGLTVAAGTAALASVLPGFIASHGINALYEFAASSFIGTWIFASSAYALAKDRMMNLVTRIKSRNAAQSQTSG